MNKRKPVKDVMSKGLLGPTKNFMKRDEESDITNPTRRVMEYMDAIISQRKEL